MEKNIDIERNRRELLSTEYFQILPSNPELQGTYNTEILNSSDGPEIFLRVDPKTGRSLVQSQHGDVVIEGVSRAGHEAVAKIFDENSSKGMLEVKRKLTEAEFLTWQKPIMNRVY